MPAGDTALTVFLSLLIVVAIVATIVQVVRLPYEIALVAAGLAFAVVPGVPRITVTPDVILTVFLPVLLFHGAYNLSLSDLRASLVPVAILAFPGVIASMALIAAALHAFAGIGWHSAILLGAIVSATDPVSVLAIFGQQHVPRRLSTIVSSESLLNDGAALVLFALALQVAEGKQISLLSGTQQIVVVIVGSLLLGATIGILGSQVLLRLNEAQLETTISVILAYGGYLAASDLGLSGALETVAAGIMLGSRGETVMSENTREQARATWEFLDFLANSLVFLLMGLALRHVGAEVQAYVGNGLIVSLLVLIVAVLMVRLVLVLSTTVVLGWLRDPLPRYWDRVIVWAGLRGAVSMAAALSLPAGLPDRDLLRILTFGVVLFTLVVQGLTIGPLIRKLGLAGP
jgi:CPA1 family monovalent cation:H+ antiporter